ncbi:MAG: response regulator transcription factor [Candidatus Obscuribacterales bacterium]|nr:response regulator transcription factor [Candidatus Obscuribacterales bacterium]
MPKILLIEDDQVLSYFIKQFMGTKKFEVDLTGDGEEGLRWLTSQEYSAAVIDWDLPKKNGTEVCVEYRRLGGQTPIIMLTKRAKLADKITGFEAGADDYLPKPFEQEELYARILSLMRRPASFKPTVVTIGELTLDCNARTASVQGQAIELSRKEFAILELLATNPEHVFSGESILDKVWSTETDSSVWAVRTHVARIRSKISAVDESTSTLIKTIYGQGYKLSLPISVPISE